MSEANTALKMILNRHHSDETYTTDDAVRDLSNIIKVPAIALQEQAEKIVNWISQQKYGNEELLHPAVCCDFVGRQRFIKSIAEIIEGI